MNIFFYGSLIHPDESARCGFEFHRLVPVRVAGYRRIFAQEPTWRVTAGPDRALLTLDRTDAAWVNGLLATGITPAEADRLASREGGYVLAPVSPSALSPYREDDHVPGGHIVTYVGRPAMRLEGVGPNPEYLRLCLEGAASRNQPFYGDFVATTCVLGNMPLATFLARDGSSVREER